MRLFVEQGFDAVGVADLCRAMGINPPSLYAAYGSKRGLFDQAVAQYGATTSEVYAAAIAGARDLRDLRRRVLDAAVELYLRGGGTGCLVMGTLSSTRDADLKAALAGMVDARRQAMFDRARELGADAEEARAEVTAISVAMMGLSAAARSGMDERALRDAASRLT